MLSEYEKEREKLKKAEKGKNKGGSSPKDKSPTQTNTNLNDNQNEVAQREINAAISEAEAINLMEIDPVMLAREITATEVRTIIEISPVEILKFQPADDIKKQSPNLYGYLTFTESLSSFVASTIIQNSAAPKQISAHRSPPTKTSSSPKYDAEASTNQWVEVARALKTLNNANALAAVVQGLKRTRIPRVLIEELTELQSQCDTLVSCEKEADLQDRGILYLRHIRSIEKHLIDASTNKQDKTAGKKFCRIIEYLNYIRSHSGISVDRMLNHAIIAAVRKTKDIRGGERKDSGIGFEGCFIFLKHSNYLAGSGDK
ncbi:hypothetical protein NEHOM01_1395 [Nematocida homosporus]|uniref:uncharacterized protein n=1 Tax=Nematocida homosporus TaxID=1912981 RepID=UPI00221F8692|nr:uncharacterized protein NEHOM01_1395 [Nematocida homosporus]KAI5186331.1 hypothetical protein NEHOM01_1395 [Nematocida homosporus]